MWIQTFDKTNRAAGDVKARHLVGFNGAQITAQGAKPLGLSMSNAKDGDYYPCHILGQGEAIAGVAVIAEGAQLISDVQGRVIPATGAAGEWIVGDALHATTQVGQMIEILLTGPRK